MKLVKTHVIIATLLGGLVGCSTEAPAPPLRQRGEAGIEAGLRFLASRQDADGAWRSTTYGALKDGLSLTPLVVKTLAFADRPDFRDAARRGARWLVDHVESDGGVSEAARRTPYPVYTAALTVMALWRFHDPELRPAIAAWARELRRHQLTDALGWTPEDPAYGGFGYAPRPLRRPGTGEPVPPFDADLSSTLFAIGALQMAGASPDDPALVAALRFVETCQNYPRNAAEADPAFDDGGFFFTSTRELPNKAGSAGTDRGGRRRFRSYGALTADGLRALLRLGLSRTHPRVIAAERWLIENFDIDHPPGAFEPARELERSASALYWAWSAVHALRMLGRSELMRSGRTVEWPGSVIESLLRRQREDGSFRNRYTQVMEDDPLIATCLGLSAVTIALAMHPG